MIETIRSYQIGREGTIHFDDREIARKTLDFALR